jgi:hypothetical protein
MDTIKLAVDSVHGINQPKRFFERYPQFIDKLDEEAQTIINDPCHDQYWDVWDEFSRSFEVMVEGITWRIVEDDDIFFVADTHVWDD